VRRAATIRLVRKVIRRDGRWHARHREMLRYGQSGQASVKTSTGDISVADDAIGRLGLRRERI
jgi:hypothetical protein